MSYDPNKKVDEEPKKKESETETVSTPSQPSIDEETYLDLQLRARTGGLSDDEWAEWEHWRNIVNPYS